MRTQLWDGVTRFTRFNRFNNFGNLTRFTRTYNGTFTRFTRSVVGKFCSKPRPSWTRQPPQVPVNGGGLFNEEHALLLALGLEVEAAALAARPTVRFGTEVERLRALGLEIEAAAEHARLQRYLGLLAGWRAVFRNTQHCSAEAAWARRRLLTNNSK